MPEAETRTEAERQPSGRAGFWLKELEDAGKREDKWRKEGKAVIERYRNDKKKARSLNILWSNTELLKPAVLSRTPIPDVRRRQKDENPVGREAAIVLERALEFVADDPEYPFTKPLEQIRDDMLLPGRGVVRVIYEPNIVRTKLHKVETEDGPERFELEGNEATPDVIDDEGNGFQEDLSDQRVYLAYVYWQDYREGDARIWEDVPWVAYKHTFTRKELVEQFGAKKGNAVPLTLGRDETTGNKKEDAEPENPLKQAIVWEVWDRTAKKRIWVAESWKDEILDEEDDPLELENFFPQPNPLYAIVNTDTRLPVPEFRIYKDQADELDDISLRIRNLIKALKVRGVYAAVVKEIANLLDGDENELFAVEDWAALKDRGGLDGAVSWFPIEQIAKVLAGLYEQRNQLKQEIFELTGLSDILRGQSDPRETKGAQQIKANFGTVRLTPRQQPMEELVRDTFRIMGEIMAENFTAEQFMAMTGVELPTDAQLQQQATLAALQGQQSGAEPEQIAELLQQIQSQVTIEQVVQLLRDDNVRAFNIDIETDSTVQPDEAAEQSNVIEFMRVSTEFVAAAGQAAATIPEMGPLFFEMYKAGARRFKAGRELEETIEQVQKDLEEREAQPPPPDPEIEKAKAELELKQQDQQASLQLKEMEARLDAQIEQSKAQQDAAIKQAESQAKIEAMLAEVAAKLELMARESEAKIQINQEEVAAAAQATQ